MNAKAAGVHHYGVNLRRYMAESYIPPMSHSGRRRSKVVKDGIIQRKLREFNDRMNAPQAVQAQKASIISRFIGGVKGLFSRKAAVLLIGAALSTIACGESPVGPDYRVEPIPTEICARAGKCPTPTPKPAWEELR